MVHPLLALPTLGLIAATASPQVTEERPPRPNVIVIVADDMGYSDPGCYGGEIDTVYLDSLAAGGLRFTRFYNAARCCPTRAALLSGLYPHQAGVGKMVYRDHGPGYEGGLNERCTTFAEQLQGAGYRTMFVGKWHAGHAPHMRPEQRGFERVTGIYTHIDSYWKVLPGCEIYRDRALFLPAGRPVNPYAPGREFYTTDFFTDAALEYLDAALRERERPFLLHLCYNAPHFPLEAPDRLVAKYRRDYERGWDELAERKYSRLRRLGLIPPDLQPLPGRDHQGELLPRWDELDRDAHRELAFRRALYAAQIESLDRNIGRITTRLAELRALDDTLILFLSDNGCSGERGPFGMNWGIHTRTNFEEWRTKGGWSISQGQCWAHLSNAPFRRYKQFVHEGGIAAPLIAHWPARIPAPGRLVREPVLHAIDLLPTLCELAGVEVSMPGRSFAAHLLEREVACEPRTLYWQHLHHAAIRAGDWKLVTENDRDESAWELYDLAADPAETHNLIAEKTELAQRLAAEWRRWAEEVQAIPYPEERGGEGRAIPPPAPWPPSLAPAPLFIDPERHGSCDPEIVFDPATSVWRIFYTARRADRPNTWMGCPIGVAVAKDLRTWRSAGYCRFDGRGGAPDSPDTFWAPAVIRHGERWHMFVTFKPGAVPEPGPWGGRGTIVHYEAPAEDPIGGWRRVTALHGSELDALDACVLELDDRVHLWFKARPAGGEQPRLHHLASRDLREWSDLGECTGDAFNPEATGLRFEEAPYTFRWKGRLWLFTDPHRGLRVYDSADGHHWRDRGAILYSPGSRPLDRSRARHPCVAVIEGRALVIYHVEPWREYGGPRIDRQPPTHRYSALQIAELRFSEGRITCDRDQPIELPKR